MKKLVIRPSKTIRQKVYEYLREQILNGEIDAGDRLVEAELAHRTGTSRTPVREALHTLEREGLVESRPRVGYTVRSISEREVKELCGIRLALEDLALNWALEKNPKALADLLRENLEHTKELAEAGDIKSFVEMDAQFHDIIAKIADSERLQEMAQSIRRYMLRYRVQSIYTKDNVKRAMGGHAAVLAAIEKGDCQAACNALKIHINRSLKDILYFGFKEN